MKCKSISINSRFRVKQQQQKKEHCIRCKTEAYCLATDDDVERGQEIWYRFQEQLREIDKSTFEVPATGKGSICFDCGQTLRENKDFAAPMSANKEK